MRVPDASKRYTVARTWSRTRPDRDRSDAPPRLLCRDVATSRSARNGARGDTDTAPAAPAPSIGDAMVGLSRLAELALGATDISPTQYRILQHLHLGRTIQSDLAFQLAISKQSVTRLVDALVDKRYLTRRVDPADRRRVIHTITARGERALVRTDAVLEEYLMLILQDLDDDGDVDAVKAGLRLFAHAQRESYKRVRSDGIVPGRLTSGLPPGKRPKVRPV